MRSTVKSVTRHKVIVLFVLTIITVSCGHQTQYGLVPAQSTGISLQQLQNNFLIILKKLATPYLGLRWGFGTTSKVFA